MTPEVVHIPKTSPEYPALLRKYLGDEAPDVIWTLGSLELLRRQAVALFCSVKCPGDLILKTYDLAQGLRDKGVTVIGGFHSPMEKEVLNILLRSSRQVIVCPARSIDGMRLPAEYEKPLAEGRLLLLSPFSKKIRRATVGTAALRNQFVAAMADKVFVAHTSPGSKTEQLCKDIIKTGKALFTLANEHNKTLIDFGAIPVEANNVERLLE